MIDTKGYYYNHPFFLTFTYTSLCAERERTMQKQYMFDFKLLVLKVD